MPCCGDWLMVCQGEDVMHDAIRRQQVEAGVPALIASALTSYEGQNEEVLWAALFSLAVLIKEGGEPYMLSTTAAVNAGLLPLLKVALKDYEVTRFSANHGSLMHIQNVQCCTPGIMPGQERWRWALATHRL